MRARKGEIDAWLAAHQDHSGKQCLIWPFAKNVAGYGHRGVNGKDILIHRMICRSTNGPPPSADHQAAHSCGNPSCVNASHLSWKTPKENMADAIAHGTMPRGVSSGSSKLKEADVLSIREIFKEGRHTQRQIAKTFNVVPGTVCLILSNKTWGHIQ